jgi:hypothetical protein
MKITIDYFQLTILMSCRMISDYLQIINYK